MTKIANRVLLFVLILVATFAAGNLSGLYFYPRIYEAAEATGEHDGHGHHDEDAHLDDEHDQGEHDEEEDHVALTKQAFENLELRMGAMEVRDYWKSRTVPGQIVEVPGKSDLTVAAPVSGVIESVLVRQGQALSASEKLLTVRITDENLAASQSELLATLARAEVVREEIARLEPLTSSGTVSGRKQRDLQYELKQLQAQQETRMQDIRARGLPESVLKSIVEDRRLASTLTISIPTFTTEPTTLPVSLSSAPATKNYSIEELKVHPGRSVQRGEPLCSLAYHAELYIQGTAFESDLPALKLLSEKGWTVSAEFGHVQDDGHAHRLRRENLELLHVENHVDPKSQTFRFYMPLTNEVEQSLTDREGRTFSQWKFKPGQRVHLKIPEERWEKQLLLPAEAVVIEGPNAFVFVQHVHDEEHDHDESAHDDHDDEDAHIEDHDDHDHEQIFVELEPVPVRLLHRDANVAVIANDGQLHADDQIALNNAFNLHLAMEMQAGGGGGHHHHHDH